MVNARLNQFGRELKESSGNRNQKWKETVECYYCHEIGHIETVLSGEQDVPEESIKSSSN